MKLENFLGIAIMLIGRYAGHKWLGFWFKGVGNMRSMPSQNRFLTSKAGQQAKELKETSKPTSDKAKHEIFLEDTKYLK